MKELCEIELDMQMLFNADEYKRIRILENTNSEKYATKNIESWLVLKLIRKTF